MPYYFYNVYGALPIVLFCDEQCKEHSPGLPKCWMFNLYQSSTPIQEQYLVVKGTLADEYITLI